MPKDTVSFRLESRLLAQFANAALKARRIPTEVLVELISDYIGEARARRSIDAAESMQPFEKIKREKVVDFARASISIKLLRAQREGEYFARRFLNGETDPQ